jgi:CrcB protein
MHDLGPDDTPDVFDRDVVHRPVIVLDALLAVFLGGALGGLARYGLARLIPVTPGHFPWATLITNVLGCALIGILMVFVLEVPGPHRLARPFLAVGFLGGFTTLSTFAVESDRLVSSGNTNIALAYLVASVGLCLLAVWAASALTHALRGRARTTDGGS